MTFLAITVLISIGVIAGYCKNHVSENAAVAALTAGGAASLALSVLTLAG